MAITGIGTVLSVSEDGGTSYAAIGNISSIDGPGLDRDEIDVTTLDTTGGYKEFIMGLRDAGSLSFNVNYVKEGYNKLLGYYESDASQLYKITLPDNSIFEFEGYVKSLPMKIPVNDKINYDVTLRIAGKPTFTEGS